MKELLFVLIDLLRPSSRYFQHHFDNNGPEEPTITATSNISRLPSVPRRLSLDNTSNDGNNK